MCHLRNLPHAPAHAWSTPTDIYRDGEAACRRFVGVAQGDFPQFFVSTVCAIGGSRCRCIAGKDGCSSMKLAVLEDRIPTATSLSHCWRQLVSKVSNAPITICMAHCVKGRAVTKNGWFPPALRSCKPVASARQGRRVVAHARRDHVHKLEIGIV